jgi:hypothetical protein
MHALWFDSSDLMIRRELPCITSVIVYFPFDIYQLLVVTLGGPANLMQASSVKLDFVLIFQFLAQECIITVLCGRAG